MMEPMTVTQQYEVEVKVLLGDQTKAEAFLTKLKERDPQLVLTRESSQLNHYFDDAGDRDQLLESVGELLGAADKASLQNILTNYDKFALRTRLQNETVLLVVKAAKTDGEDDQHALARVEGEYPVNADGIDELDRRILAAGYDFLSKWSRDRREYGYKGYTVCLDRNAGYGYLAEVETVVDDPDQAEQAKSAILKELAEIGEAELSQARIGRMFAHYNRHWPEYYQTDKTFTIE